MKLLLLLLLASNSNALDVKPASGGSGASLTGTNSFSGVNSFAAATTVSTITVTGEAILKTGSLTEPSLYFAGDSNTGMYWGEDNDLRFASNGVRIFGFNGGNKVQFFSSNSRTSPSLVSIADADTGIGATDDVLSLMAGNRNGFSVQVNTDRGVAGAGFGAGGVIRAQLEVRRQFGPLEYAIGLSSSDTSMPWGVQNNGHVVSSGTMPTIACDAGTGSFLAGVDSNDMRGVIVAGAAATNCTLTFANPGSKTVICIYQNKTSLVPVRESAASTTASTVAGTTISGDSISYMCGW